MRCAAQNHAVSGSLERCIAVPAVIEVCRPQSRHSYSVAGFSAPPCGAAADRADETVRPAPFEQERRATRLVRKCLLEFRKRARLGHRCPVIADRRGSSLRTVHIRRTWDNGISRYHLTEPILSLYNLEYNDSNFANQKILQRSINQNHRGSSRSGALNICASGRQVRGGRRPRPPDTGCPLRARRKRPLRESVQALSPVMPLDRSKQLWRQMRLDNRSRPFMSKFQKQGAGQRRMPRLVACFRPIGVPRDLARCCSQ